MLAYELLGRNARPRGRGDMNEYRYVFSRLASLATRYWPRILRVSDNPSAGPDKHCAVDLARKVCAGQLAVLARRRLFRPS